MRPCCEISLEIVVCPSLLREKENIGVKDSFFVWVGERVSAHSAFSGCEILLVTFNDDKSQNHLPTYIVLIEAKS